MDHNIFRCDCPFIGHKLQNIDPFLLQVILINHFIHVIGLYTGSDASTFTIKLISEGSITGGLIIYVPLTIFIAKITHKLTGSVWMGTLLNSFLTAWMWVSAISSTNVYMGTTFAERFFGF